MREPTSLKNCPKFYYTKNYKSKLKEGREVKKVRYKIGGLSPKTTGQLKSLFILFSIDNNKSYIEKIGNWKTTGEDHPKINKKGKI